LKRWWHKTAAFLLVSALVGSAVPTGAATASLPASAPMAFEAGLPLNTGSANLPATGRVIVKFSQPQAAAAARALAADGGKVLAHGNPTRMVVDLPDAPAKAQALVAALRRLPGVAYVENDEQVAAFAVPNDEWYSDLWGHERIGVQQAWGQITPGTEPVVVAVIDTGADFRHRDLNGRLLAGRNFVDEGEPPVDDHGHGTHVSGTIAALHNNGLGITGVVGPANVKILPVKALNADGKGSASTVAAAIEWAADHGADVINLSLGGSYTQTLAEAVRYAANAGVVVVAAAGNDSTDTAGVAPAGVPGAITVSALQEGDTPADFSNWGDQVEVAAPGVQIRSTVPVDGYAWSSGTSMAAPHVAGVAALIKAAHPSYTRAAIQACLLSSLQPADLESRYGAGVLRADLAVACNAAAVGADYALKLEGPDPDAVLAGMTTFTFDVRPSRVASIQVKDERGATLGKAKVTGDLTDVMVDLNSLSSGPATLTAVALNNAGQPVTTVVMDVVVDQSSVTIDVMDEQGYPVLGGYVELFAKESQQYRDRVTTYWNLVGGFELDDQGRLELSTAAIPAGNELLAIAYGYGAQFEDVVRFGTVAAPGKVRLEGPLVRTTFALPPELEGGDYFLTPQGDDLPPAVLWAQDSAITAWVPPGDYEVAYGSDTEVTSANYWLRQTVTLEGAAASVTTSLKGTTQVTWTPTAGRTYDWAAVDFRSAESYYGRSFELPTGGGSVTVTPGEYVVNVAVDMLDDAGSRWYYYLSDQAVTVPAKGLAVTEGTLTDLEIDAPTAVKPGQRWGTQYTYWTDTGTELWWADKWTSTRFRAAGQPHAVTVVPGRAPIRRTLSRGEELSARVVKPADWEAVLPDLQIATLAGQPVATAAQVEAYFGGHTWKVPAKMAGGQYRATVSFDGGPLGSLAPQERLVTVGSSATVSEGVRVTVTGANGQPVAGARVAVLQPVTTVDGEKVYVDYANGQDQTDASGLAWVIPPFLKAGDKAKLAVTYESEDGEVYLSLQDVTLPAEAAVSLTEGTRPVTVTALNEAGVPILDGLVGVAYIDENKTPILDRVLSPHPLADGEVTFHLSPGKVRFIAADEENHTFTAGAVVAITPTTTAFELPAGPLTKLAVDPDVVAPDGSPMAPRSAFATPENLPGWFNFNGEDFTWHEWRVTPGTYQYGGKYIRMAGDEDWAYELTGKITVGQADATITAGGPITASIDAPTRYASGGFVFPFAFMDAHGNRLTDMTAYDPNYDNGIDFEALAARAPADLLALQLGQQAAGEAGAADGGLQIAPFFVVRNEAGDEIHRSKSRYNWHRAVYDPPAGLVGALTAEISLGVGPEGAVSASVPFSTGPGLTVTPKLYNPAGGTKLNIVVSLPRADSYTIEVRTAQGALVDKVASGAVTGAGAVTKTWDGKNAKGSIAPNGTYKVVVHTEESGTAASPFQLKVPVKAAVPSVAAKSRVNTPTVAVSGKTTPGFTVAAQVKVPGANAFAPVEATQTAGTDGKYGLSVPLEQGDGAYQIQVRSIDPEDESNASNWSKAVTVTRDMTAPQITWKSPVLVDGKLLVSTDKVTLEGTTEAGARVEAVVTNASKPVSMKTTANTKGAYKITSLSLKPGANTITLLATDEAGNVSDPVTVMAKVDKVAPSLVTDGDVPQVMVRVTRGPETEELSPSVDKRGAITFATSGAGVTRFQLTGVVDEMLGRVAITPTAKAKAPAITDISPRSRFDVELLPAANGTTAYTVTLTDLAGNARKLPSIQIRLDSAGPTLTIDSPKDPVLARSDTGDDWARVTLAGKGSEDLAAVQVIDTANPEMPLLAEITRSGKNYSAEVRLPLGDFDRTYTLRVIGEDLAGNPSAPHPKNLDTIQVKVDLTAPAPPTVTSPAPIGGGLLVGSKSLQLAGTAEPGAQVTAQVGDAAPVKPVVAHATTGAFSFTLPVPTAGTTVKLWAKDAAGNQSATVSLPVTYDAAAPQVESLTFVVGDEVKALTPSAKGWSGSAASAKNYALNGTFTEAIAKVLVGDKPSAARIDEDTFSLDLTILKNGTNTLKLKVYDFAGNAATVTVTLTLDTQAPVMTVAESNLATKSATATFTVSSKDALQAVRVESGNGEPIDDLDFDIAAAPQSTTKWTVKVTMPTDELKTWSLRFKGVDLAGNVSTEGAVRTLTVDPDEPVLDLAYDNLVFTKGSSITVTGTVSDAGSGVKNLTVAGSKVTPVNGKFSKSVSLTDGRVKSIAVVATDNAGNEQTYTFDVVRKSTVKKPAISAATVKSGKVTISGTADVPVVLPGETVLAVGLQLVIRNAAKEAVATVDLTPKADGRYSTVVDLAGWAKGTYTIELTTTLPEAYADLGLTAPAAAAKSFTVK
jgi:thermitase